MWLLILLWQLYTRSSKNYEDFVRIWRRTDLTKGSTSSLAWSAAINCRVVDVVMVAWSITKCCWIRLAIILLLDWLNLSVSSKSSNNRTGIDTWICVNLVFDLRFIQSTPCPTSNLCIQRRKRSLLGNFGLLMALEVAYNHRKRLVCIGNIARTWLFHWPVSYNDWPIIVVLRMILLVGGVLLRITAPRRDVG